MPLTPASTPVAGKAAGSITAAALAAALFTTGAALAAEPAEPNTQAHQPQIDQIMREISAQRIKAYNDKLVGFGTRHSMSDTVSETRGIGAARRWIKAELERCGAANGGRLQVAYQSHIHPVASRISRPTEIVNVVATLPGTQAESEKRMYVVSGHYDSINGDVMNFTDDAPGSNDDGSGTSAVMELACVMSKYKFDATIVFMTVAAEEQGLYGSGDWAEKARKANLDVAGMFTNDIIGSSHSDTGKVDNGQVRLFAEGVPPLKDMPDELRTLIRTGGENDSITRQLARHVKEMGERYVNGFKVNIIYRRDRYLRGGDHSPFLDQGYAALRFTEPAENFAHQHQTVRKENGLQYGDLPEFIDPDYIVQVARVNAAALATLALAPAAPKQVQVKAARLQNDTELQWQPNPEPDLAGYRVVWRDTTAPLWQGALWVGNVNRVVVPMSKDNVLFGVQAVDKDGNVSVASYPVPVR